MGEKGGGLKEGEEEGKKKGKTVEREITSDVIVKGLVFMHTASTFMQHYSAPNGGDWAFYAGFPCAFCVAVYCNVLHTASPLMQRYFAPNGGGGDWAFYPGFFCAFCVAVCCTWSRLLCSAIPRQMAVTELSMRGSLVHFVFQCVTVC